MDQRTDLRSKQSPWFKTGVGGVGLGTTIPFFFLSKYKQTNKIRNKIPDESHIINDDTQENSQENSQMLHLGHYELIIRKWGTSELGWAGDDIS